MSNKRFLFYAPHVVGECMEILQSDIPGEIQNEDWLQLLRTRENAVRVTESQLNRLNPRDTYSRVEPEDLLQSSMKTSVAILNWNGLNHLKPISHQLLSIQLALM